MASPQQRILITGATAGIGRHAALHFARLGFHVIATGRNAAALDALRAEAGDLRLDTVVLDVNDRAAVDAAVTTVDELTDNHGIDVLVNNAGFAAIGAMSDMPDDELRALFDTNVFGLMAVTRAFLPKMIARRAGRIINVSSSGGRISLPMVGGYHAAKFAVEAMSDALRWELAAFGVRVVLIEPGPIRSEFGARMLESVQRVRPDSIYTPIYADVERIQKFAEAKMKGPETVVRAIERGAVARRPRARYMMPWYFGIGISLFHMLPTRFADWLMCKLTGLTRKKLLPAG